MRDEPVVSHYSLPVIFPSPRERIIKGKRVAHARLAYADGILTNGGNLTMHGGPEMGKMY